MYIRIKGVESIDEISNYCFDNKENKINIWFHGNPKKYSYCFSNVDIGPIEKRELKENEIVTHENRWIENIKSLYIIGDGSNATIKISTDKKVTYYKCENIKFEVFNKYIIKSNEHITIDEKIKKISSIEFSDNFSKVKFIGKNGYYIYKKDNVKIEKNSNSDYENMMNYYIEISKIKDLKMEDKVEKYLENQLNDIVIQKEDTLYAYFLGKAKKSKVTSMQNIYPFGINLSQREGIINALSNQLSLIQGPPGTGKTRSILNIVANLIIQEKTVAVVSSNNEAVKNVKEKMEDDNYGFIIALLGKKENKELFFENQKDYPEIIHDWSRSPDIMKQLLSEIQIHESNVISLLADQNNIATYKQMIYEYEHEHSFFVDYLHNQDVKKLIMFDFFKLDSQAILELLIELQYKIENKNILYKIKYFFKYGIYNYKQFDDLEPILIDLQNKYYSEKIKELKQEVDIINAKLESFNFEDELSLLEEKSKEYFQAFLSKKFSDKERMKFNIKTYHYDNNFEDFMKDYPIILSTTHAIYKSKNMSYKFDYLIVDEASQVELVPGIIALNSAKNAVIVGDLKQLPHIPEEKIKKEQYDEWEKKYNIANAYSYYDQNLLSSFNNVFKENISSVLLKEHYRCDRRIISFCNRKYYNDELICLSKHEKSNPLVLLKTVAGNHMRYGKHAVNKITNVRELESLVDQQFLDEIGIDLRSEKSFGFMAPFRGQVNVSKDILPSEFQKDTVHKFQGRECDVVMFSSVLDKKKSSNIFMDFVDESSLINVAVSRAVEKFILVSDVDVFKNQKGEINDLIRYMEYYEEDSILYESEVRSIFDLLYSDYIDLINLKKENPDWLQSKYDTENLTHELLDSILSIEKNKKYKYSAQVKLKELFRESSILDEEEKRYIKNNASVDFVVYNKFDNQVIMAIEVDGFHFHDNNPKQLEKDEMKNSIFERFNIPLIRLKTNSSQEEKIIESYL